MTPILFALFAAAGNLLGAAVVVRHARKGIRVIEVFVAFGAGFMAATVILAMLPEAFEQAGATPEGSSRC